MKTQYYTAASLDGFIATSDHSLDWLLQFGDVEETSYPEFIRDVGALAMGSSTYEWILRNDEKAASSWPYHQPTWILTSRKLQEIPGSGIQFVKGDVRPIHQQMAKAAGGKNIWIAGGGDLAGQFYDQGLLDELIITIAPVTLGSGIPLFPRTISHPPLKLLSVTNYGVFTEIRYDVPQSVTK